jgi:hypothetical protein
MMGQCRVGLTHRFEIVACTPLLVGLLDPINLCRHQIGPAPLDAAGEQFGDAGLDHWRSAAELLANDLGLFHESAQHAVFRPLRINEIPAVNPRSWLELAVDAAVALFEATRVPGEIGATRCTQLLAQRRAWHTAGATPYRSDPSRRLSSQEYCSA